MCGRRGRGGKMPNLPQSLTTQEPASLTGEGLPLDSEAPLRECSESLQAKYLINDSQQTHIKSTHTPPPSSAGPQRNWIKCTPSAIPPTGPRAKNSSTSCTYNTRTHTSMQTHIYTQPKWGCSYINADRMQPTPMGCTAIPYMHFFYILKMSRSPPHWTAAGRELYTGTVHWCNIHNAISISTVQLPYNASFIGVLFLTLQPWLYIHIYLSRNQREDTSDPQKYRNSNI